MYNMKKSCYLLMLLPLVLSISSCKVVKNSETNSVVPSESVSEEISDPETPKEYVEKELDKETARDKILGGWIGQALGIGSGFEYVVSTNNVCEIDGSKVEGYTVGDKTAIVGLADKYWEPNGQIGAGSIGVNPFRVRPVNDPRVIRGVVYSDDDMHVDVLNQFIFRDYGPKLGNNDIASAWKFYDVHDVGGGQDTRNLVLNSSYIPPYTGQSTYGSMGYWVTESWIENETLGMLFPYMYETAEGYADMFTQVQGDAYGYYLGKLCAIMYSLAYEYDDAKTIIDKAFEVMGKSNEMWDIYQYVLKCYKQGVSWRQACIGIVERAVNCAKIKLSDTAGFSINANAGMIFLGLVYGENDFEQSMKITSLAGLDGDCTAATVAGLVGMIKGFKNLPEKYRNYLNGDSIYYNHTGSNGNATGVHWGAFAYCGKNFPNALTFNQITDLTVENLENVIKEYNGAVEGNTYKIAGQELVSVDQVKVENYSFEDGNIDNWTLEAQSADTSLTASSAANHIGTYGGLLVLADPFATAKVYQSLDLIEGHTYKATIWINGANDREFKFFATDGTNTSFKTFVNPVTLSNRHMKAEVVFKATSNKMNVGVDFCQTYEDAYSTTVGIDDFFVEDITRYVTNKNKQVKELEAETLNGVTVQLVESSAYSGGKAAYLESDDSVSTTIKGVDEVQSIKIYYDNKAAFIGALSLYVDGKHLCNLPIVSTGVNNYYNDSNYAEVQVYLGEGDHQFEIKYMSFDNVYLDKLVVSNANRLLES